MNAKIKNARHVSAEADKPLHMTLRSRATAALTAGCLALSLCPAVALAAPSFEQGADQGAQSGQPLQQMVGTADELGLNDGGWQSVDMEQGMRGGAEGAPFQDQQAGGQEGFGEAQPPTTDGWQASTGDIEQAPEAVEQAPMGDMQQPIGDEQQVPMGDIQATEGDRGSGFAEGQIPAGGEQVPAFGEAPSADAQVPSGEQVMPEGQAPAGDQQAQADENAAPGNGQREPFGTQGGSPVDDQVRQILADDYGVQPMGDFANVSDKPVDDADQAGVLEGKPAARAPQGAGNAQAPAAPEGEANVQAVIDTTNDIVREYGADKLESADFSDNAFLSELTDFAKTVNEQREALFASLSGHDKAPVPNAKGDQAPADEASDAAQGTADTAPAQPSESVLGNLVSFLAGFFGFAA